LRPLALGICRGWESLHYVKVVIIITEDVHASNSISFAHIVLKILQLQVWKLGCMWVGHGLARLRSRLWLLQLLGQRETGLWLMWVLGLHNWLWRQLYPPTSGVCGCFRPFILHACGKSQHGWSYRMYRMLIDYNLPYILGSTWSLGPCLAFKASTDPVDTSAQAALAPHQTTEQEESADNLFMVM
jgi:hypothetical protein